MFHVRYTREVFSKSQISAPNFASHLARFLIASASHALKVLATLLVMTTCEAANLGCLTGYSLFSTLRFALRPKIVRFPMCQRSGSSNSWFALPPHSFDSGF